MEQLPAMNLLFKTVTSRNLVILAALAACASLWYLIEPYPRRLYHQWRYPPQEGTTPGGREILGELERAQARKVEARYRRVWAMLDEAQAAGFDVRGLRAKARAALAFNEPAFRRQALRALTEVEMAIPRRKAQVAPASPSDEEAIPQDVRSKRAAGVKRSRPR